MRTIIAIACLGLLLWVEPAGAQKTYSLTVSRHPDVVMGLEGIVSKRLGSRYRSGRSPDWLKFKNPEAPAVRREAEEDWGKVTDRKEAHSTHRTSSAPSISSARATASNNRPLAS